VAVVASAVLVAGLLLVVVLNIDQSPGGETDVDDLSEPAELVPRPLTADDLDAEAFDPEGMSTLPVLAEGGWIQVADEQGKLAQQYRFDRLDPNPPGKPAGWAKMARPRAEIYRPDHRVVSLEGDSALVHLPHRVLDSGTITGNVTIRLFELSEDRVIDVERDRPSLVVHTEEAEFDNFIGEVRCDRAFYIETPALEFHGQGLVMLIDDLHERVELAVEQVDVIRLISSALAPPETVPDAAQAVDDQVKVESAAAAPESPAPAAAAPPDPAPAADDKPPKLYRLTLQDNVRIRQGGAGGRTITGDTLTVVFSPQSEGLAATLAASEMFGGRRAVRTPPPPRPLSPAAVLVVGALASLDEETAALSPEHFGIVPPPADEDIYIRCSGNLTMVPIIDPEGDERLDSDRDARLKLTGRPVRLFDAEQEAEVHCDHLLYHALAKKAHLVGSPVYPLTIAAPQLEAGGEVFWLAQADHVGGFTGPGWLRTRAGTPDRASATNADAPAVEARASVPAGPAAAGTEGDEAPAPPLNMAWTEGVDLEFEPPAGSGPSNRLRRAAFRGSVEVSSRDGNIHCDELDLALEANDRGETVPTTMAATGDVRAADADQTVWADHLFVRFGDEAPVAPDPSQETGRTMGGRVTVESFTAEGDVQVALADQGRAFADRLTGDAVSETAELTGSAVAVAYHNWLIDQGRRIMLHRQTGHWPGPGRARFFNRPTIEATDGRIERPSMDEEPQIRARWDTSLRYDSTVNDGAGAIDLSGNVEVTSETDPQERNTINASTLTVGLAWAPDADDSIERRPAPPASGGLVAEGKRAIGRVIADGDARLESRRWIFPDRSDKPSVLYVAGPHLEYDEQTGEALVDGAGELLIRDLSEGDEQEEPAPFGAKGTTAFRWKQRLDMRRVADTRYDLAMTDGIEVRHLDPAGGKSTLACARLEATIDRPGAARLESAADLDPRGWGGPAELRRLRAEGDVFVRTPTRDVECDELEYDVDAGIAQLAARPGRLLTVYTRATPQSVRMQRAEWDLKRDTLTVVRGSGAGSG
jgi:lipopolysaccharide export system protein LptA